MWHLLALSLVALITWFLYRTWSFRKRVDVFPGPPALPIIGNVHQIGRNGIEFMTNMKKLCEQYGPNFRMFIGPFNATIILTDPRDIEILLKNNKWLKKSVNYTFIEPWLGQGLVTSSGERWRKNRKIITPTFHFKILEQFVPVFNTEADTLIQKLEKNVDGPAFDMNPYINLFALDVICETSMGTTVGAQHDAGGEYVLAVKDLCGVVPVRTFSPFLRYNSIFKLHPLYQTQVKALKVVHSFVDRVIAKRRKLLADTGSGGEKSPVSEEDDGIGKKKKVVFLDLLLQSTDDLGSPLPDSIIKDEVHTFMFAGHDTTTGAMSFTLYLLSRHPEIQDKVFQEQRDILGDDLKNNPTYSDLQEMNYLTMVIKEALRIYCSIPAYSREMTEDGDFRGKIVPAGVTIGVNAFLCHRNPEHWPEPNKFDPDRFTPEETAKRHPFAYVPFSAGSRNCMGQKFAMLEMKSCVSKVLRNFELLPFGKDEDLLLETAVVLKCKSGINMKIKKRKYT